MIDETNDSEFDKMLAIVNDCIKKLPKRCQEIFILSKKQGYTNIEISEKLKISVKTVEAHITNAFKSLRADVENYNY